MERSGSASGKVAISGPLRYPSHVIQSHLLSLRLLAVLVNPSTFRGLQLYHAKGSRVSICHSQSAITYDIPFACELVVPYHGAISPQTAQLTSN